MSTQERYSWKNGPAKIKQHSIAKHQILRSYLNAYFQTLAPAGQPRDEFKLTLVDGFAGGGLYFHETTKDLVKGSPFILLEAEKEADFRINHNRTKPVRLDVAHFFIESDRDAYLYLKKNLTSEGYESRFGSSIHILNSQFENEIGRILEFIRKKSPRNGRSIFILDQFGYSSVPTSLIRQILSTLRGAEVILTFAVDALLTFADQENFESALNKAEIPNFLRGLSLQEIKDNKAYWRLYIQSGLYKSLVNACGARYFTPFFIRNRGGHGDYWLIHLSQHYRARDVMTQVHWQNQNYFIHYGGPGFDMFNMIGYDPTFDDDFTGQKPLGFEFDDEARKKSIHALMKEIPKIAYAYDEGISYEALFVETCNGTPASSVIYQEALGELLQYKEIEIIGMGGAKRKSGNTIKLSDRIIAPDQKNLFLYGI